MSFTGVTTPGASAGGADKFALLLKKFGGEIYTAWRRREYTRPSFKEETLTEAKSTQEKWLGTIKAKSFVRGTNMLASADQNGIVQEVQFREYIVQLDLPLVAATVEHVFDRLMSPAGDMERMELIGEIGQALAVATDLRRLGTLLNGAAFPDPGIFPTGTYRTKAAAGTFAGFSVDGATNDGAAGLNVTAAVDTGGEVETELGKHKLFHDHLWAPLGPNIRRCYMRPDLAWFLARDTIAGGISAASASKAGSTQVAGGAGNGSIPNGYVNTVAGWDIISCPYLSGFGTFADDHFGLGGTGDKYFPGNNTADASLWQINSLTPTGTSKIFEINGNTGGAGVANPDSWETTGVTLKAFFDKVLWICAVGKPAKTNILQGIGSYAKVHGEAMAELIYGFLTCGHGPINPLGITYQVSSKT